MISVSLFIWLQRMNFKGEYNFAIQARAHACVMPSQSKVKPSPDGLTQKFAVYGEYIVNGING